jgi:hypothetical protein
MSEHYSNLVQRHLRVARVCADLVDDPGPSMAVLTDEAERLLSRWEAGEAPPEPGPSLEEALARVDAVEGRLRQRLPARPPGVWQAALARPRVWGSALAVLVVAAGIFGLRWRRGDDWATKSGLTTGGVRADQFRQGYGVLTKDKRAGGQAVTVDGKPVDAAFVTHAYSRIDATVVETGRRLTGRCGYPDDKRSARMSCRISGGGKVLFESPPLDDTHRAAPFDVVVPADRKLTFEVRTLKKNIDFAHAVWANLGVRP